MPDALLEQAMTQFDNHNYSEAFLLFEKGQPKTDFEIYLVRSLMVQCLMNSEDINSPSPTFTKQLEKLSHEALSAYHCLNEIDLDQAKQFDVDNFFVERIVKGDFEFIRQFKISMELFDKGLYDAALEHLLWIANNSSDNRDISYSGRFIGQIILQHYNQLSISKEDKEKYYFYYLKKAFIAYNSSDDQTKSAFQRTFKGNFKEVISDLDLMESEKISLEQAVREITETMPTKKTGCYIATACLDKKDINSLYILTSFRDRILINSLFGRLFIRFYYFVSPTLANLISKSFTLQKLTRLFVVNPAVSIISRFK